MLFSKMDMGMHVNSYLWAHKSAVQNADYGEGLRSVQ